MISQTAALAALVFFTIAMIYAALQDAATLTIRNRLVLIVAGGYLVFAPLAGFALVDIGLALGTGALVLAATFTLFAFGWLGGGDAKLMAATALWLGPEGTLIYLAYTTLFGGILAIAILCLRTMPLPATLYGLPGVALLQSHGTSMPYALAMTPAALLTVPSTHWFTLLG